MLSLNPLNRPAELSVFLFKKLQLNAYKWAWLTYRNTFSLFKGFLALFSHY